MIIGGIEINQTGTMFIQFKIRQFYIILTIKQNICQIET